MVWYVMVMVDCPDAAYFGPHIREDSDDIEMLRLQSDAELHLVTLVNHRELNVSHYSSIALLTPATSSASTLSKTRMKVRATSVGVTSFDFPPSRDLFVSWAFSRNPDHCERLTAARAVDGCTVVLEEAVKLDGYLTYCERIYLNPVTATGPDWSDVLPARLYHFTLNEAQSTQPDPTAESATIFAKLRLPAPVPVATYPGEPLRFLHIVKTGGESLEHYLAGQVHVWAWGLRACLTIARHDSVLRATPAARSEAGLQHVQEDRLVDGLAPQHDRVDRVLGRGHCRQQRPVRPQLRVLRDRHPPP